MPRSSAPLDYSSFTRFVEDQDNGRLLTLAEERRRANLFMLLDQQSMKVEVDSQSFTPSSISVAFSPRPLESIDLLDDLRCLVRSIESLEQENKRLRGRCAYLSTVNDLLSKQQKPLAPCTMTTSVVHNKSEQLSPDTNRRHILICETFSEGAVASPGSFSLNLPQPSPATDPASNTNTVGSPPLKAITKDNALSPPVVDVSKGEPNRLSSFGAKMTKAATKFLSKPKKLVGSPQSKSVRDSGNAKPMLGGLEPSSSGSSLAEPIGFLSRSKSFINRQKHASEIISSPSLPKRSVAAELISSSNKGKQRHPVNKEPRTRSGSESRHGIAKLRDGSRSEDELDASSSIPRFESPAGSGSFSPMVLSTDSLGMTFSPATIKHFSNVKQSTLVTDEFATNRGRAWTWDVTLKTATKPWLRLKQMLRRASSPYTSGTAGMLNDTVDQTAQLRSYIRSIQQQNISEPYVQHVQKAVSPTPVVPAANDIAQNPTVQPQATTCETKNAEDAFFRASSKTLNLLAMAGSGEVRELQESQRKQIAKALLMLKAEDEADCSLDELNVPDFLSRCLNPAVLAFVKDIWVEMKAAHAEKRETKRSYLSDRLKLLEWANSHCSRFMNAELGRTHGGSMLKQRHSQRSSCSPSDGIRDNSTVRARYHDSTGLCYGNSKANDGAFRPRKIKRRWFSIGAADGVSSAQKDVSCRLAASLCGLFTSLEPLHDLDTAPMSMEGLEKTRIARCDRIRTLFDDMKAEIATASTATIVPTVTTEIVCSPASSTAATPIANRVRRNLVEMSSRSLSRDDHEIITKQPLEGVCSSPIVSQQAVNDSMSPKVFSPMGINLRKQSVGHHLLMSADELVASVARSRSSSIASTARTNSISLSTASPWPDGSRPNLVDKRASIADVPSNSGRNPSFAALAIAMDFVTAARQRASSIGSQSKDRRLKPVTEPDLDILMSPTTMSPIASERLRGKCSSTPPSTNCDSHTASPTPPLISPSQSRLSPVSLRSLDTLQHVTLEPKQNPPQLPSVQRIAPVITVSPDQLNQQSSRGRFKSLNELSDASPISKIFAQRNAIHRSGVSSTVKSAPGGSPSPVQSISTSTPSVSGSSNQSKATVVAHLCPPPILTGEPASTSITSTTSSPGSVCSSPEPSVSRDPIMWSDPAYKPKNQEKGGSKHFKWFTKLWRSPSPLKRFSSCGVGPSEGQNECFETPGSPPHSLGSLSPTTNQKQSALKRFLKKDSKQESSSNERTLKSPKR